MRAKFSAWCQDINDQTLAKYEVFLIRELKMKPYKENIGPKILLKNHQNNSLRVRVKTLSFSWPNQVWFWNEQLNALNRPKHI